MEKNLRSSAKRHWRHWGSAQQPKLRWLSIGPIAKSHYDRIGKRFAHWPAALLLHKIDELFRRPEYFHWFHKCNRLKEKKIQWNWMKIFERQNFELRGGETEFGGVHICGVVEHPSSSDWSVQSYSPSQTPSSPMHSWTVVQVNWPPPHWGGGVVFVCSVSWHATTRANKKSVFGETVVSTTFRTPPIGLGNV